MITTILLIICALLCVICGVLYWQIHRIEDDIETLYSLSDDLDDEQTNIRADIESHERNIVCTSDALVETNNNIAGLKSDFEKVSELIDAAKERETAAVKSEKLFQDGLSSIMNYDYTVAMGKKNDDV